MALEYAALLATSNVPLLIKSPLQVMVCIAFKFTQLKVQPAPFVKVPATFNCIGLVITFPKVTVKSPAPVFVVVKSPFKV